MTEYLGVFDESNLDSFGNLPEGVMKIVNIGSGLVTLNPGEEKVFYSEGSKEYIGRELVLEFGDDVILFYYGKSWYVY